MSNKTIFNILLVLAIAYRFCFQFIFPKFNGDEIAIGINIKESDLFELLKPLHRGQSAPPLFLIIQKLIITHFPGPFWIKIKLLSFIASTAIVVVMRKWVSNNGNRLFFILPVVVLFFNPFLVYNSLTVKQYVFDLLGIVCLLTFFRDRWFKKYGFLFFIVWILFSNVGLFGVSGYLLSLYFEHDKKINLLKTLNFFKKNITVILSPIPYVIYFFWYKNQQGYYELYSYMQEYWKDNFITFNKNLFSQLLRIFHSVWIYFYSYIEILGGVLFAITSFAFIKHFFFKNKDFENKEITLLGYIILVHIFFNFLKLYPFSDRLILYTVVFFVLLLTVGIYSIFKTKGKIMISIVSGVISIGFAYNLNYATNDVYSLMEKLNQLKTQEIYLTNNALSNYNQFNNFTDYYFRCTKKLQSLSEENKMIPSKGAIIVSDVHKKYKPNKTAKEEQIITELLKSNKLTLIEKINGFNLYIVN